jgi:hypothetical protein
MTDTLATVTDLAITLTLTHFSSSEAETITLTPMGLQRLWRNRGYLPSHDGTARYDLFALAELMALKLIANRTGPLLARHIATVCGQGIAGRVLSRLDGYEGDHWRIGEWEPEAFARTPQLHQRGAEILANVRAVNDIQSLAEMVAPFEDGGGLGFDTFGWLRDTILRGRGIAHMSRRFLVWFGEGRHEWTDSLDAAFDSRGSSEARFADLSFVLDLDALATVIQERAGRAFVGVEMPS